MGQEEVLQQSVVCPDCLKARRENIKLWHNTNGRAGVSFTKCETVFCRFHMRQMEKP